MDVVQIKDSPFSMKAPEFSDQALAYLNWTLFEGYVVQDWSFKSTAHFMVAEASCYVSATNGSPQVAMLRPYVPGEEITFVNLHNLVFPSREEAVTVARAAQCGRFTRLLVSTG